MKIEEAFIRFRDDIKEWVTNNLNAIGKPKASDVAIDTPSGMTSTDVQGAVVELNKNFEVTRHVLADKLYILRCGNVRTIQFNGYTTSSDVSIELEKDDYSAQQILYGVLKKTDGSFDMVTINSYYSVLQIPAGTWYGSITYITNHEKYYS